MAVSMPIDFSSSVFTWRKQVVQGNIPLIDILNGPNL